MDVTCAQGWWLLQQHFCSLQVGQRAAPGPQGPREGGAGGEAAFEGGMRGRQEGVTEVAMDLLGESSTRQDPHPRPSASVQDVAQSRCGVRPHDWPLALRADSSCLSQ